MNTNATTTQTALIAEVQFAASGSHTYQVKALGTAGHPMVDVDGFVIISNA